MNKKSIDKTMMFLNVLKSRMTENKDFFEKIRITLRSGAKEYFAEYHYNDDVISFDYLGEQKIVDDFSDLYSLMDKYDSVCVRYLERSAEIIIDADDRNVKMQNKERTPDEVKTSTVNTGRRYLVNPSRCPKLLKELGVLAENGKIKNDKVRKYNQIDYFLELMNGVIDDIDQREEMLILDCACGKSYLSFVMNYYFTEVLRKKCHFIGVDFSETVIESSKKTAQKLGYKNMTFIQSDLAKYTPDTPPDLVVSLHACDTLTDMALALGIRSKAKAIMSVPCCHKDILKQYRYEPFSMVTKHGILKARLADTLTDALRASFLEASGYNVSMIEYISPLETPKNIMIRAVRTGKKSDKARNEYETLKNSIHVSPAIEKFI